jgi:hypothetical protein
MLTVEDKAATLFKDEVTGPAKVAPTEDLLTVQPQGESVYVDNGPQPPLGRQLSMMEIDKLRAEGHTINNDNEPVKENVVNPGPPLVRQLMKPTSCPRIRDGNQKVKGRWINFW